MTREKAEELDGAGGVCAKGPVATMNARRAGRHLERPPPIATFSATLLVAASMLEAICIEISISPPGAPLS
eukprot:4920590-Pleurochrysis_carterae.AAC.1